MKRTDDSDGRRNPDYPPSTNWDACQHEWRERDSQSEGDVVCKKCGVPGESRGGHVYWPAT